MLVLRRKVGERIMIGDGIEVPVLRIHGGKVRLGFTIPPTAPHPQGRGGPKRRIRAATAPSGDAARGGSAAGCCDGLINRRRELTPADGPDSSWRAAIGSEYGTGDSDRALGWICGPHHDEQDYRTGPCGPSRTPPKPADMGPPRRRAWAAESTRARNVAPTEHWRRLQRQSATRMLSGEMAATDYAFGRATKSVDGSATGVCVLIGAGHRLVLKMSAFSRRHRPI